MEQSSYYKIMEMDTQEHNSCPFRWNCENCYKSLYLRIAAVADFPSTTGHFKIIGFANNKDKKDHIAVVRGDVIDGESVLTRLPSSCLTGDVLGSLRCDCGPQLEKSVSMIEEEGIGVLLYMQQEEGSDSPTSSKPTCYRIWAQIHMMPM